MKCPRFRGCQCRSERRRKCEFCLGEKMFLHLALEVFSPCIHLYYSLHRYTRRTALLYCSPLPHLRRLPACFATTMKPCVVPCICIPSLFFLPLPGVSPPLQAPTSFCLCIVLLLLQLGLLRKKRDFSRFFILLIFKYYCDQYFLYIFYQLVCQLINYTHKTVYLSKRDSFRYKRVFFLKFT